MNSNQKVSELLARLEALSQSVEGQQQEIRLIRQELRQLLAPADAPPQVESSILPEESFRKTAPPTPIVPSAVTSENGPVYRAPYAKPVIPPAPAAGKRNLEEYIGGNLINKIGIEILVLGVGIFLNYAIENDLISPAMRIVLGAVAGLLLVGLAYRLKKDYHAYSAVLLSGGVATLYFSTYVAYDFYSLLPHAIAFILMLAVTIFTVYAAIKFDQQVIGVMGQAGAYAVPLLLSQGSGQVAVLFTYMVIINGGIAWVAFSRNWPLMNATAFVLTWLTFGGWFALVFVADKHLPIALIFGFLFFALFYVILAFYQLPHAHLQKRNTAFLLLNASLFYLFGYLALDASAFAHLGGTFTLLVALLHGGVAWLFYHRGASPLFYVSLALSITFLTIAIPVQFNQAPVTLLWATEAVVLYWISLRSRTELFASFAAALVLLSSFSLMANWSSYTTDPLQGLPFLLNRYFMAALWVTASQIIIRRLASKYQEPSGSYLADLFKTALPVITGLLLYSAFFLEINHYFNYRISQLTTSKPEANLLVINDLENLRQLCLISFSALYITIAGLLAIRLRAGKAWNQAALGLALLVVIWWLVAGLGAAEDLRESYMQTNAGAVSFYLWIRYVGYTSVGVMLFLGTRILRTVSPTKDHPLLRLFTIAVHTFVLAVLSAELLQLSMWLGRSDLTSRKQWAQKVGFSVLWGLYSLGLVAYGFRGKQKLLRFMGIGLFAITLTKLFLFDLSNIPTIGKIIAFVGLGILLLIISFLYQKYKSVILGEEEPAE